MPYETQSPVKSKDGNHCGFSRPRLVSHTSSRNRMYQRTSHRAENERKQKLAPLLDRFLEDYDELMSRQYPGHRSRPTAKKLESNSTVGEDIHSWESGFSDGLDFGGDSMPSTYASPLMAWRDEDEDISNYLTDEESDGDDQEFFDGQSFETSNPIDDLQLIGAFLGKAPRKSQTAYRQQPTNHQVACERKAAGWDAFVTCITGPALYDRSHYRCRCKEPCKYECDCDKTYRILPAVSFNGMNFVTATHIRLLRARCMVLRCKMSFPLSDVGIYNPRLFPVLPKPT